MSAREAAMDAFQGAAGWGSADRFLLAGDASFRTYYRLVLPGQTAVLMDAPPPQEDVRPFLKIARFLVDCGLSAPRVIAEDVPDGFLLLEDLGDDTYTRLLGHGLNEEALYALAVDTLAVLHQAAPPDGVPAYDDDRLRAEADLLPDWFLPAVGAAPDATARAAWAAAWEAVLPAARGVPDVLVLRDYHVDNLLLLPRREGVERCGLLDFQDAVVGPLTYDLMSLLEDARRDIAAPLVQGMMERYLTVRSDLDRDAFAASWAVLAAVRHAKVIGIFTRLHKRDGKAGYLPHLPRVWGLLDQAVAHPVLEPVKLWLDAHVPAEARARVPE